MVLTYRMVMARSRGILLGRWRALWVGTIVLGTWGVCHAEEGKRELAASRFDEGVAYFERGEMDRAARAFLEADQAAPSLDALMNALAAARKAGMHLLVSTAASRVLQRQEATETQRREAWRAQSEAATHLAWLRATCRPAPCNLVLDDEPWTTERQLVPPGVRILRAEAPDGTFAAERVELKAGTSYDVTVNLPSPAQPPDARVAEQNPDPVVPTLPPAPSGLSPAWTYAGVGVTTLLLGATIWSGTDTLRGKNDLSDRPSRSEVKDVEDRIRRTDLLLGGTVLAGAATALVAWQWTAWDEPMEASGSLRGDGATLMLRGSF